MKTKQQKQTIVKELTAKFKAANMIAFTAFAKAGEKGLSVSQTQTLKRALRAVGGEFVVAKKRLVNLARQMAGLTDEVDTSHFVGSIGVVVGEAGADSLRLAKDLHGFTKINPVFQIFGAVLDGRYINQASFITLAKTPSREVLLGRLFGMLQYPLSGLVNVLQGNMRNLVVVLDQVKSKKQ